MKNTRQDESIRRYSHGFWRSALLAGAAFSLTSPVLAQENDEQTSEAVSEDSKTLETVVVSGIRQSLASALAEKRAATTLKEVINAEDIGKLPDQNLAEVLENVTGVQITRTAGVGTGVQIRGTNSNRTLINGVATLGSGAGRSGISFNDVSAAMISSVEVIKSPEAKTLEGSVGGTINLRTIRPLDLNNQVASVRIQGEESSLSSEGGFTPRIDGTYANNWSTGIGEVGAAISLSYSEQEATSYRPRLDRDGSLVENINADVIRDGSLEDQATRRPVAQDFDFLGIQFLNQELENFEFETFNFSGAFEWAPKENIKFYLDTVVTDQERRQDSTRVQASGVSSVLNYNLPTEFETVNFGSLGGQSLGSIQAAVRGTIQPDLDVDDDDPNLRFNSDTGARITDTRLIRIGTEVSEGQWSGRLEVSTFNSDTETPTLSSQLNFINPNPLTPLDGTSNDNAVPFIYDLTGERLTFGVDFASPFAPTVDDLLNPANVVLDQVDVSRNSQENGVDAFLAEGTYELDQDQFLGSFLTSIDAGYRFSKTTSTFNQRSDRVGGFSRMVNSPNGTLFADLLVQGPTNFGDADGRELAFRNFLIVDPNIAFEDQAGTLAALEAAVLAHDPGYSPVDLSPSETAFFDVEEKTHALYAQGNFEYGIFRGNAGLRFVETEIASTGNTVIDGVTSSVTTDGSYNFLLPRVNVIASPVESVQLRFGYGKDIRRPDFNLLNSSVTFGTNENTAVTIGNPSLEPEEVESFDIAAEWYFAPSAVFSVGYFHKERTNIFGTNLESASLDANGLRSADPSCPGGGLYNPAVQPNILGDPNTTGLCVDFTTNVNDPATTTQTGFEFAFQYDLSGWEDMLGWASGFGVIANYTIQEFDGGSTEFSSATRGTDVFNAINGIYDDSQFVTVSEEQGLLDFSENAYNVTAFYEKYGLSARLRYTWRDAFRTLDTAAGASLNSTYGFPVVTSARGQLNGSINYDVTDNLNIGLEAVNITEEGITQWCVNDGALLCAQGIPDRRIVIGATYSF